MQGAAATTTPVMNTNSSSGRDLWSNSTGNMTRTGSSNNILGISNNNSSSSNMVGNNKNNNNNNNNSSSSGVNNGKMSSLLPDSIGSSNTRSTSSIGSNSNSKSIHNNSNSNITSSMKDYYYTGNSLTWDSQTFKRMGGFSRLFNTTTTATTTKLEDVDELVSCGGIIGNNTQQKNQTSRLEDLFTRPPSVTSSSSVYSYNTDTVKSLPSSSASICTSRSSNAVSDLQSLFQRPTTTNDVNTTTKTTTDQDINTKTNTTKDNNNTNNATNTNSVLSDAHTTTITINALSCLNSPQHGRTQVTTDTNIIPPPMSLGDHQRQHHLQENSSTNNDNNINSNNNNNINDQHIVMNGTTTAVHLAQQHHHQQQPTTTTHNITNPGQQQIIYHHSPEILQNNNVTYHQQQQQQQSYSDWSTSTQQQQQYVVATGNTRSPYMNILSNNTNELHHHLGSSNNIIMTHHHHHPYLPYNNSIVHQQQQTNAPYTTTAAPAIPLSSPIVYPSYYHPYLGNTEHHQQTIMSGTNIHSSPTLAYTPVVAQPPVYTSTTYHPQQQQQQQHINYSYQQQPRPPTTTVLYPYSLSVSDHHQQQQQQQQQPSIPQAYVVANNTTTATMNVAVVEQQPQQPQHYVVVQHTLDGQVVLAPTTTTTLSQQQQQQYLNSPYATSTSNINNMILDNIITANNSSNNNRKNNLKVRGTKQQQQHQHQQQLDNKNKNRGENNRTIKGKQEDSSSSSSILDEFKRTYKSREWTVRNKMKGHVVEFCKDQNGSRFLQSQLDSLSEDSPLILEEILLSISDIKNDVFGNYVLQKILEREDLKTKLWMSGLKDRVMELSLQMYGCRVVQKAVEKLNDESLFELIDEFRGNILQLIEDQNGNHVCQKLIEVLTKRSSSSLEYGSRSSNLEFIIDDVIANVSRLSCHPYGCRVLQRILEHCHKRHTHKVLDEISKSKVTLLGDQYGNYVIQHVLQYGRVEDREGVLELVLQPENGILKLSRQKFASNVVEKLLKYGNACQRKKILIEMLKEVDVEEDETFIVLLMVRDPYANYVVQTSLDVAPDGEERQRLLAILNSNSDKLRTYTFAKHIVAKLFA